MRRNHRLQIMFSKEEMQDLREICKYQGEQMGSFGRRVILEVVRAIKLNKFRGR